MVKTGKKHIITTAIEHKAVLETVKHLSENGFEVEFVKPGINGRVNATDILKKVREDTLLVSVMHVNNETGIIQPVKEIGDVLDQKMFYFMLMLLRVVESLSMKSGALNIICFHLALIS